MIQQKVFTVEEANKLIPELSNWVVKLREKSEEIAMQEVKIDAQELVTNHDSEKSLALLNCEIEHLNQLVTAFNEGVEKIHSHGCFLKDVRMGLVDFYTVRDGKVVYLCWKFGEGQIAYWHEVGMGYPSRQPL